VKKSSHPAAARRSRTHIVVTIPPLFERLIYYILIPDLVARLFFEFALGIYFYTLTQPKQWIFYGIVAVEYLFQSRALIQDKFRKDSSLIVSGLMLVMIVHGTFVGFAWQNPPIRIFVDSVPLVVVAVNVLLLNHGAAFAGFSFDRLNKVNTIYAIVMVIVGLACVSIGRPSIVGLGGAAASTISLTILLASFAMKRTFSFRDLLIAGIILIPIAPNLTRTALVIAAISLIGLFFTKIIVDGKRLYFSLVTIFLLSALVPLILPPESPVMRRIQATMDYDPEKTQGSIGERQAEWLAINDKLERMGTAAEWFGAGHGAAYEVQFTLKVVTDYSHAHYSWALLKLRYGNIGYVYLLIFVCMILYSFGRSCKSRHPADRISMILLMWSFVYLITYVMGNFFIAGLQFANASPFKAGSRVQPIRSADTQVSPRMHRSGSSKATA
jgi:hypothetical protein